MPRSIEEIDAELAEVRREKALRNALGFKQARTKAILTRDTSDLNNVYRGLNSILEREAQQEFQAAENEKSRQSTEKIARMNKEDSDKETRDQILRDVQAETAILDDMEANPDKYTVGQVNKQRAYVKYYERRAAEKGIDLGQSNDQKDNEKVGGSANSSDGADEKRKNYMAYKKKYDTVDDVNLTSADHYKLAGELEGSEFANDPVFADDVRGLMFRHYQKGDEKANANAKAGIEAFKAIAENPGRASEAQLNEGLKKLSEIGKDRFGNWRPNASEYTFKFQGELDRRQRNANWDKKVDKAFVDFPKEKAERAADAAERKEDNQVTVDVGRTPVHGYPYRGKDGRIRIYSGKGPSGRVIKTY